MPLAADRLEFTPPPQPGMLRAFVLAVIAHVLLMLALTWGINWKRESDSLSAEAELWSSTPQQAAPKPEPVPAPPPPPPAPVAKVEPPPAPVPRQADIALEREKKKQAQDKLREQELEREKKLETQKKQEAQKKLAEQKKQDELKKQELAKKEAEDKKKAEAAKAAQAARLQEASKKAEEARRLENLNRMQGLAGATGSPSSTGTAQRASGPSDSYGGRIRAKVRPNIVFTEDIAGNPTAEVEVRMAPDGTIIGKRIVKSSGVKSWDEAVLRALDKTEVLPRDVDGRVHTPLVIEFRPKS
jgi:colicin import membrane protein